MTAACPRLRPVEIFPTTIDGVQVICLRDPSGQSDQLSLVPPAALAVLALLDGEADAAAVARGASRRLGATVDEQQIHELLAQLDDALLLDTPRFHAHAAALVEAFRAAPRREAAHAGASYPESAPELATLLDGHLVTARARARATAAAPARGVIAPHIDFARGAPVYGDAYAALADAAVPDLIVVLGTDHVGVEAPFTLTRKPYATPFGDALTDVALVDALARRLGPTIFAEEFHHRSEHSVEFQAVWLAHVLGARLPPILPVLCGPICACTPDSAARARDQVTPFLSALGEAVGDRRVLVVAGADLAHVGPRFGDAPFGAAGRARVEAADRRALGAALGGDPAGFWNAVGAEHDQFRICGLAPVYAMLELLARQGGAAPSGRLLSYDQCPADEHDASWVTIAAGDLR